MSKVGSSTGTKIIHWKWTKSSQEISPEILIEVYRHYRELALNEDRLFNERLMVFLTSQSILFLGYITCFQVLQDYYFTIKVIMILLPFVGIFLCFFEFFLSNPAKTAWEKWLGELKKIEKVLKGNILKRKANFVFPSKARKEIKNGCFCSGEWPWWTGCCGLPLTFLVLWIASFCCSLCIVASAMFFC